MAFFESNRSCRCVLLRDLNPAPFADGAGFVNLRMSVMVREDRLCGEPLEAKCLREQVTQSVEDRRKAWDRARRAACAIAQVVPNLKGCAGAAGQRHCGRDR